jgi:integrase
MRANINQRLIECIKSGKERSVRAALAAKKPIELRDMQLSGFVLRVQPTSRMSYFCNFSRGKRVKLGNALVLTPAQARNKAIQVLGIAAAGEDPRPRRKKAREHTLRTFIDDEYEPWALQNRKDGSNTVKRLRACFAEFFGKKLADVNPWIVEKWRTARLKSGVKPATINRDITALKALLSKAVEWRMLHAHPLGRELKPVEKRDDERVRFLSDDEELRLRSALDAREEKMREERDRFNRWRRERGYPEFPSLRNVAFADHLKPMVLVSMNTGLRRGELFSLAWESVSFERAILTVKAYTAKSSKTRHVPVNDEALSVLRAWRTQQADTSNLVFPSREGARFDNVKKSWGKLLADADIADFRGMTCATILRAGW